MAELSFTEKDVREAFSRDPEENDGAGNNIYTIDVPKLHVNHIDTNHPARKLKPDVDITIRLSTGVRMWGAIMMSREEAKELKRELDYSLSQ